MSDKLDDILKKHGIDMYAECGEGWSGLIDELVTDLIANGWDKDATQIKEKFGGLRFYIGAGSKKIHKLIERAERKSLNICEHCGSTDAAIKRSGGSLHGWLKTLCGPCAKVFKYG